MSLHATHARSPIAARAGAELTGGLDRPTIVVALVVTAGLIMAVLDTTIVNVALDTLSRDLNAPLHTIQWVATGYLLALAVVTPLSGWVTERFGSKRTWITCIVLFAVGSSLCALASSASELIAFRVVQGLGGGMLVPVGFTLVAQSAGPQRMGRALSLVGVPILLGPILGPVIGGLIIDQASWRWIFLVNVPIAIVAVGLAATLLPARTRRVDAGPLDWRGAALLCPGLASIVFGLSEIERQGGITHPAALGPLVAGFALVGVFAWNAMRTARPLIDVRLFRSRGFRAAAMITFTLGGALYGTLLVLPLYYQVDRGLSALDAGLLLAPQGLGAALALPISGRLTDRLGGGRVVLFGTIVLALATVPLVLLGSSTPYAVIAAVLLVRGIGLGASVQPTNAAAYSLLTGDQVPRATAALNTLRQIGGSVGTALLGGGPGARAEARADRAGVPPHVRVGGRDGGPRGRPGGRARPRRARHPPPRGAIAGRAARPRRHRQHPDPHGGDRTHRGALMPARRIRVVPADPLRAGFEEIRREAEVPERFPPEVEAEARAAAAAAPGDRERVEVPFVTIDPPGSRDLDQALHIERRGEGHRVRYAIADVGAFVARGGALDRATHTRGVTVYAPDEKAPLHPPVLSEGAASLLPGEWRPAVLWTLDLDATGALAATDVRRAEVRSVAQHTYADAPAEVAALLREVGERRLALERERGGVRLAVPEQEVVREDGSWTVRYRVPLATEDHNAQVSLLTGMAAAQLMLRAGTGILRTQKAPGERSIARLRRQAAALGVPWPDAMTYPEFVRTLDPAVPAHAAVMHEATGVGGAAGYTAFDGALPADAGHFAVAASYAHATAPLRRLQDRFVSECCLAACAGAPVPDWVRQALPALPEAMSAGAHRAGTVERGVVDLVEAAVLAGREGERFDAVVIDDGLVQLREPAVRGPLEDGGPPPGSEVAVRLETADVAARKVAFRALPEPSDGTGLPP